MVIECGGCGGPVVEGSKLACPRCLTFIRVCAGKIGAFGTIMQNAADAMADGASEEILAQHRSILAEAAMIAKEITKQVNAGHAPGIIP